MEYTLKNLTNAREGVGLTFRQEGCKQACFRVGLREQIMIIIIVFLQYFEQDFVDLRIRLTKHA